MKYMFKFDAILSLLLVASAIPATAQNQRMLTLKTSFAFSVETHELPAGDYRIRLQDGWLQIQGADGKAAAFVLTFPSSAQGSEKPARAVFHRYGSRYFLSEVWLTASDRGRQTLEPRAEKNARKQELAKTVVLPLTTQTEGR